MIEDANAAIEKYHGFEFAYRLLKDDDLAYLRERSRAYKHAVRKLQELILRGASGVSAVQVRNLLPPVFIQTEYLYRPFGCRVRF